MKDSFIHNFRSIGFICFAVLFNVQLLAQSVHGKVIDQDTKQALENVQVQSGRTALPQFTDQTGRFQVEINTFPVQIVVERSGYETYTKVLNDLPEEELVIELVKTFSSVDIPTISLTETQLLDDESSDQNISGILTASDDLFYRTAAFTFGPARFNLRG